MIEHQKTRYDKHYIQFFQAFFVLVAFEALGFFCGPSPWIWLKSEKLWLESHLESFDKQLLEYLSLTHKDAREQYQEIISDQSYEAIPVSLFVQTSQKDLKFWAYPLATSLKEHDIILGERGLIGRVGKAKGQLWEVYPLCREGMKMTLKSQKEGFPLLFEGQGYYFEGTEKTRSVRVGDFLYTLETDTHYPSGYPVAQVIEAQKNEQGIYLKAKPLDFLTNYRYARAYRSENFERYLSEE